MRIFSTKFKTEERKSGIAQLREMKFANEKFFHAKMQRNESKNLRFLSQK